MINLGHQPGARSPIRESCEYPFTYLYTFRMRPNAYPKRIYEGTLLIESDAKFAAMAISVIAEGREEEAELVARRYHFSIRRESGPELLRTSALGSMEFPAISPILFKPSEAVPISLMRDEPKPRKLLKRADGGSGVDVQIWINGVKRF